MPCRDQHVLAQLLLQRAMSQQDRSVTAEWLVEQMRNPAAKRILVLDCRPPSDFHRCRVREAINVTLPASIIMMRRLADGKLHIPSVIKDNDSRDTFVKLWQTHTIILYDDDVETPSGPSCVLNTLFARLKQDGCDVVCLQGGFTKFHTQYPEWCEKEECDSDTIQTSLVGLENLHITSVSSDTSESDQERCDSGVSHDCGGSSPNDTPFPVEILPYLFLGNSENSCDLEALERHKIRYILNVTPNLPNTFEQEGLGIKYMQIPIQDHWSQNLASFFPEAIAFIDEARQKKLGVLVHCLAGISRSVTITLAYLMQKCDMPLNDAYDFVRQRKANISPNLNFLGQLQDFERELQQSRCTCTETPCECRALHFTSPTRTTPDSGIDLERWT